MCSECFEDLHKKPAFIHHESGALGELGMTPRACTVDSFLHFRHAYLQLTLSHAFSSLSHILSYPPCALTLRVILISARSYPPRALTLRMLLLSAHSYVHSCISSHTERKKAPSCLTHKKELELYCISCRGLVCVMCVTLDGEHRGHQCMPLEDYIETCKEELVQVCIFS